jgi:hypothetical protein
MPVARIALVCCLIASPAAGQIAGLSVQGTLVFYGDDTEFSNPFRTGETLVGTFGTVFLEGDVGDRMTFRAGGFGHWKFGSPRAIDRGRPYLSLIVTERSSRFIFGTLETSRWMSMAGPDRAGPHGLLPPMQQETLAFTRAHENGIQWTIDTDRFTQDAWINWQRLNTRENREVFDAGWSTLTRVRPEIAFRGDVHIVHQGGQKGGVEPVSDSSAAAFGLIAGGRIGRVDRLSFEINALGSRFVPDRERPELSHWGFGTLVRLAIEDGPWRTHLLLLRGDDFVKVEGDPLRFHDGTRYRGVRDYLELGATRRFAIAPGGFLEASVRFHRTEDHYEFSARIVGVARLGWRK